MPKKFLMAAAMSHAGLVRANNEDCVYFGVRCMAMGSQKRVLKNEFTRSDRLYIFAVCDGMGGEAYGEKASLTAASALKRLKKKTTLEELDEAVKDYLAFTNNRICLMSKRHNRDIGTTIALLCIRDGKIRSYNLGDSRVYMYRDDELSQLSRDHTFVDQLVRIGAISKETARVHPQRHQLSRYLGFEHSQSSPEPYVFETDMKTDDVFIVCSDGLTEMCEDGEIRQALRDNSDCGQIVMALITKAIEKGGLDNISAVVIKSKLL